MHDANHPPIGPENRDTQCKYVTRIQKEAKTRLSSVMAAAHPCCSSIQSSERWRGGPNLRNKQEKDCGGGRNATKPKEGEEKRERNQNPKRLLFWRLGAFRAPPSATTIDEVVRDD